MRRGLRSGRDQQGLTLLELVIAVAVLSLGAIATTRAMDQARLSLGGAMPRLLAQVAAQNRAEELRLLGVCRGGWSARAGPDGPLSDHGARRTAKPTAGGLVQARIVARSPSGPGAVLLTFVPPQGPGG
ncbi:prepilin-type N-terminal cleavage/methylation domain-containing protein (plasmid) [Rhodobacteraceae bacterium M382]|nr:prepilin-type N-terminal cleavage/methylation domain-containing protein [Rhodobacteraceae bacterium M382]